MDFIHEGGLNIIRNTLVSFKVDFKDDEEIMAIVSDVERGLDMLGEKAQERWKTRNRKPWSGKRYHTIKAKVE